MARFAIFGLAMAVLALAAPTLAEPTRVNDLLVLDGTVLQFNPVHGLNDTTEDTHWQLEYMKSLLTYHTSPEITARDGTVEKRLSATAICFQCMISNFKMFQGPHMTRKYTWELCAWTCVGVAFETIASNPGRYAGQINEPWQRGDAGYDAWTAAPRE
ncbi:hypothetical protein F4778DRAFT_793553 [Xylariomycetidae sp. FL2044]|nr:hypothetical protein F4778DRAFT_793553 [Xylariomycetidae sp. FL2044]